jgi:hypothetical protein
MQKESVVVAYLQDIKPGDGVAFEVGKMEHEEPGGIVLKFAEPSNQLLKGGKQISAYLQQQAKMPHTLEQLVVRGVDTRKYGSACVADTARRASR